MAFVAAAAVLAVLPAGQARAQERTVETPGRMVLPADLRAPVPATLYWFGDQTVGRDVVWLAAPWRMRAGDDPAWAAPETDDREWAAVPSRLLQGDAALAGIHGLGPGAAPVIWLRMRLEVPPALRGRPLALWLDSRGAAEVYVDGRLAGRAGDMEGAGPALAPRVPIPVRFEGSEAVVAVRYSLASGATLAARHQLGDRGFWLGVEDGVRAAAGQGERERGLAQHYLFFAGVLVAFALLHGMLFLFYRDPPANFWYEIGRAHV